MVQNIQEQETVGTEHPVFNYTLDDEPHSTIEHILTPTQILDKAGISPKVNYLVQLIGAEKVSYQDKPEEQIHMHQHMKFMSVYTGETPVSDI